MDKENKNSNVPNLRFFGYDNDWSKYKCSDLLETFSTNSLTWDDLTYSQSNLKNIHYGLIHNGFNQTCIKHNDKLIPYVKEGKEPKNYTSVLSGDLILADASEDRKDVGRPIEIIECTDLNLVSGLHTIHSRDKNDVTEIGYKGFYFQSKQMKEQLFRIANGSKIYSISPSNFSELYMSIPSKSEQKKIVYLLQKIEDRIVTQIKIIEVKRLLKDLIIDNCIFKSNDCEYVEVYNFADLKNGYAFKSNNYTDCGKYKVITIGNVSGERYLNLNKLNYLTYIPLDIQKHQILKKGDLLISLTGNVGRISICNEENCLLNQRVGLIELFNVNDYEYLYQVMASKRFQNDMVLRAQGAAQPNIGKDDVLNYRIPYLNNLNKRKKISSVLRLLDNSILSDENLLITYNKQKQYLLRNLFI